MFIAVRCSELLRCECLARHVMLSTCLRPNLVELKASIAVTTCDLLGVRHHFYRRARFAPRMCNAKD